MKFSLTWLALIFLSFAININSEWENVSAGMHDLHVYSLAANSTKIFAGTPQSLSVSNDNGASWYLTMFNAQTEPVYSIALYYDNIYAGVQGYGLTVSPDNGSYWTFHHPVGNRVIYSVTYHDGYVFAGASVMNPGSGPAAVHRSADNGYSFPQTSLQDKVVLSLASSGNILFAGTQNEGIYLTTNNGTNWSQTSLNNQRVQALATSGSFIFAGTIDGIFVSSDHGSSWVQSPLNNMSVSSLAVSGNFVFAGSSGAQNFYASSDNGTTWTLKNENLGSNTINALCIKDNYIFAGTSNNGVYRRLLGDLVSVQPVSNQVPSKYSLSQNYPNPFNPETKIKFDVPASGLTQLIVYDALGREVSTVVNEQLNPGTYVAAFNASYLSSGVYYYKLVSGDFIETRRMILLK